MREHVQTGLVVLLAFIAGAAVCALIGRDPAAAQTPERQWRQCFVADFGRHADGDNPQSMRDAHGAITIPQGWIPVGGAGTVGSYSVVLCR